MIPRRSLWVLVVAASLACTDDEPSVADATTATGDTSTSTGDGDPSSGDGDGDPSTGDGDGDPSSGDGDGDPTTGDGDGDPGTGDGDGDPSSPCEDTTLIWSPGEVFTPSANDPVMTLTGGLYPPFRRVEIEVDVHVGPFRDDPEPPEPPTCWPCWDHILFELYRDNQAQSWERMLIGASARIFANQADRAYNYGRVDIAAGASSYISWKSPYPWTVDSEVHLRQWIDADTDEQTLEIYEGGVLQWSMTGDVPYYDPGLTTDGLYLNLGTEDADWGLHYSPHGWTFSNLLVCAWEAR